LAFPATAVGRPGIADQGDNPLKLRLVNHEEHCKFSIMPGLGSYKP
jgi:hypothetical protein